MRKLGDRRNATAATPLTQAVMTRAYGSEPPGRPTTGAARVDARAVSRLAWRVVLNFAQDRVTFLAGGVSFFVLLGVFPALSAFLALWGLFADPHQAGVLLGEVRGMVPPEILAYIARQMRRIEARGAPALGVQFAASLVVWIWTADMAVKALIYGLNLAQHQVDRRNYLTYTLLTLKFTVAGLVFVLVASAVVVAAPQVEAAVGWRVAGLGMAFWRWPFLFLAYLGGLWPLYRYGPCRPRPRRRRILPGAFLAAALSLGVSLLFSWYIANVVHLSRTYGPVGATVAFMLWTWATVTAVLTGGELNGELERCSNDPP